MVAEQLWRESKKAGVQIVPADCPELFRHFPSPSESFMRRVLTAQQEYERDVACQRMMAGLAAKKEVTKDRTQAGTVKVNGRKSILDEEQPSKRKLELIKMPIAKYQQGSFGLRTLGHQITGHLGGRKVWPEAARRMIEEIESKGL